MQYSSFAESYKDPDTPTIRNDGTREGGRLTNNVNVVFDIDNEESFRHVLDTYRVVVVDVWANFCNPCRRLAPRYKQLAEKYRDAFDEKRVIFLKDNAEDDSSIHRPFCHVVPTFFVYVNKQRQKVESFGVLENAVVDALRSTD